MYRKGNLEIYKKQIKSRGKGRVYFGVISGQGASLVFSLGRPDGFEKNPTPAVVLRDFLNAHTSLKLQPSYCIVDLLPETDVEDHEELTSETEEHDGLDVSEPTAEPSPGDESVIANGFSSPESEFDPSSDSPLDTFHGDTSFPSTTSGPEAERTGEPAKPEKGRRDVYDEPVHDENSIEDAVPGLVLGTRSGRLGRVSPRSNCFAIC